MHFLLCRKWTGSVVQHFPSVFMSYLKQWPLCWKESALCCQAQHTQVPQCNCHMQQMGFALLLLLILFTQSCLYRLILLLEIDNWRGNNSINFLIYTMHSVKHLNLWTVISVWRFDMQKCKHWVFFRHIKCENDSKLCMIVKFYPFPLLALI